MYLQFLHRVLVHLDSLLPLPVVAVEIGEFRGHEELLALVMFQGDTCAALRLTLTIDGRGVEIVQAMLNGIVYLFVDHVLVKLIVIVGLCRQTHHAIPQNRHFLLGFWVLAVGHLTYGRFHLVLVFLSSLITGLVAALAACQCGGCGYASCSKNLQEVAPRYILIHLVHHL